MIKRSRCGKIVATVGPSCNKFEQLEKLHLAGVDVFRLNFSHSSQAHHEEEFHMIREIGRKHRSYPTVLADLQGPKLRVGEFENGRVLLEEGDTFCFDLDRTPGDTRRVCLPHPEILNALTVGTTLLLDDGKLRFEVKSCRPNFVEAKIIVGGLLSDRKGVNVPHVMLPIPALTEKDKNDLEFVANLGVDWIALSFVQSVDDIEEGRRLINGRARLMAKLEKPLAIRDMDAIIEASDAIMVARGDLGVEMSLAEVPMAQKHIMLAARRLGKPVVVATQMLESMITSPTATRAEISDIANAVYEGADATMLSAESASGKYSEDAVRTMNTVIEKTESDPMFIYNIEDEYEYAKSSILDSLCTSTVSAAICCSAKAIILYTDSIEAVERCANMRPTCPIFLFTDSDKLASVVGLYHGVFACFVKKEFSVEKVLNHIQRAAEDEKIATSGEHIVVLDLITTNSMSIHKL